MCRYLLRVSLAWVTGVIVLLGVSGAWATYAPPRLLIGAAGPGGLLADDYSIDPSISADGRFVTFVSSANNLVDIPTTQADQVYVLDRATDRIERVSVSPAGLPANSRSEDPVISADGRFVAFMSYASNLVDGDTNGIGDIFVRDLVLGTTARVSVDSRGGQANRMVIGTFVGSLNPTISANGRFVAFMSAASNLSDADRDNVVDVFVHDRVSGGTVLASLSSTGEAGDRTSYFPLIAPDGSFIVFESFAGNLVGDDTNGRGDLFLRDLVNGTTERLTVAPDGSELPGGSGFTRMSSSADGRFIAFEWDGDGLVAGDSDGLSDVFVYDRTLRRIEPISTNVNRSLAGYPAISGDGRHVAFLAATDYLVPGSPLGRAHQVFVHDRATGATTRVSETAAGVPSNGLDVGVGQTPPAISGDGRVIVFTTEATNLDPADVNGEADLYEVVLAVDPVNRPPVADAGADQVVGCSGFATGVTLDGSGSLDPDGDALVYRWTGDPDPADVVSPRVSLGVGSHAFTLAVDDGRQTGPVDSVLVTVRDEAPPVLSGPADRVVEADVPGGAAVAFDEAVTDACDPAPTLVVDPAGPYPVGVTGVSVTARDAAGNAATRELSVTVVDTTPPVLVAPPAVAVRPTGSLTFVALGMPTVSDLVGPVTVDNDAPAAGFPVGDTVVTWTALDGAGNLATAQQRVSVSETAVATGPGLRHGRVDGVDHRWRSVSLPTGYVDPVVVASVQVETGQQPTVVRVRNVASDRFEVRVQAPSDAPLTGGYRVHYLVAEAGVYTEATHGVRMEAGRVATATVDGHANGWSGTPSGYANAYAAPVVLGQVISANDARWSVFWAAGAERRAAPDGLALTLGRHVGDDPDTQRQPEQLGYIVIEAGSGVLDGLAYEAGVSEAEVTGATGASPGQTLAHRLGRVSGGVVSSAGMLGRDGGWPVWLGAAPFAGGGLDVVIAEDQLSDDEVAHQPERVAYVVVGSDAPVSNGPMLYHGRLDGVGDDWQAVTLPRPYAEPVVVATVQYDGRQLPAVARVRHAAGDRFEVRVQNPGRASLPNAYTVHYLVAEAGVYDEAEHGIRMEALRYLSARTDGEPGGWIGETRAYVNAYAEPVVLGQVMSANDERWSAFWARGVDRWTEPDPGALWLGKHVGEDPDTDRAAETIGYLVIESGTGSIAGRTFEAGVSGRIAGGTTGSPPYPLPHGLTTVQGAILSMATMRGSDGGWPVLYGAEPLLPLLLDVAIDEDQLTDGETAHKPESLGYFVVE